VLRSFSDNFAMTGQVPSGEIGVALCSTEGQGENHMLRVQESSHTKTTEEVFGLLESSENGLSSWEAERRLREFGPNQIQEARRRSVWQLYLDQFKDFMILVLLGAAVVSAVIGDVKDGIAIIVIVFLNAVIGFVQEYRAEKAMTALKRMAAPMATVLRDGKVSVLASAQLVPGDVVLLEAGAIAPADLRLTEVHHLKIDEAALTGESVAVEKAMAALSHEDIPLGDRLNMAYKGTVVAHGRGWGVVLRTGMKTEIGRIAGLILEQEDVKTPLQKRLAVFGKRLAAAALIICAIVFVAGLMRGESPTLMFLTAVSLAVAAIPEALPAVVTISLALGARKMVRKKALIRKLPAVETLGSVTYICSDKTGTLTLNRMAVEKICCNGQLETIPAPMNLPEGKRLFFQSMALNNDAVLAGDGSGTGDPTEIALLAAAQKAGFSKDALERQFPRIGEIPFDSDRKCMTTFHAARDGRIFSITKGGGEVLLGKAKGWFSLEDRKPLDAEQVTGASTEMAAQGLRVLALGVRYWDALPEPLDARSVESNLLLLGLVGLMDPPREEAKGAVAQCKSAGIIPVMITGDHPVTARTIGARLGMIGEGDKVMTGSRLQTIPMEAFLERVKGIKVYARVAPEQKLKIVKALQAKGEFVAMTGDGVNDAPALKRADIGVAMGMTGTDVAKEASHMMLLDDNFASIVGAVQEGRKIYDNIRKFVKYTMTSNLGEIWTIFLAPFMGLPIPLLPIHILWINLVTDGLPGLALAAEPEEKGIMTRPPRAPRESIFAHGLGVHIVWVGLLMGLVSIATQGWAYVGGNGHWQTMVFTVLCLSQLGHVMAIRSERESLFVQGLLSNRPLLLAVLLTGGLQVATVYVPVLQGIFKTQALSMGELALCLAASTAIFWVVEVEKVFRRRSRKNQLPPSC
jgi:Ca2+-transporting ATPase